MLGRNGILATIARDEGQTGNGADGHGGNLGGIDHGIDHLIAKYPHACSIPSCP